MSSTRIVPCLLLLGLTPGLGDAPRAASSFAHDPSDPTKISSTARVRVDPTARAVTLQPDANVLADGGTLLFTELGSTAEINAPAIARGAGGTARGITHTSGGGGHSGEAAIITGAGHVTFPVQGNFNPRKGTIDFWMSLANWGLDAQGHTSDYPHDQTVLYAGSGNQSVRLVRNPEGKVQLQFHEAKRGLYSESVATFDFAPGSWHHFTFTWNIEEDVFYIASWLDGVYQVEQADPSPNTFDPAVLGSFEPRDLYIGNRDNGNEPLNGTLDDLRISETEYSATSYPGKVGIVTGTALDTGVPSPVWGSIRWNETLPPKTDIELQTSASDDGSNWTSWLPADRAMISITFDDGYSSVYDTAYPIMQPLGFAGVAYITTNWIGQPNRMKVGQLRRLQDAGWEIGGHGSDHITSKPSFAASNAWLTSNGLGHSTFAYPGGVFDQTAISDISDYYTTARTIIPQYQTYSPRYRLYSYPGNTGPNDIGTWLDSLVAKRAWGILTFHSIGQPDTPGAVPRSDFTAIMQHLADRGIDVVTIAQALSRLGLHTDNRGEQIVASNKRYLRYRAILLSHDGIHTPILSDVVLSAPTKLYLGIDTTVHADGTYDHATWPQTPDTRIDDLVVAPDGGSVIVRVDTWESAGAFHRKWTETASGSDVATSHTMGQLLPGNRYSVKRNGGTADVLQASATGQITFKYPPRPSAAFEVEQAGSGPSISDVSATATATEAQFSWTTGESASSAVDYGLAPSYGASTPETDAAPGTTSHSVKLSGLRECTTYHFRVRSKGQTSVSATSADGTFTTSGNCPKVPIQTRAVRPTDTRTAPPKRDIPWAVILSSGILAFGVVLFVLSLRKKRRTSFRR